jgi:hypothetical protein
MSDAAARILAASRARLPAALRERLPELDSVGAWLAALGVDFAAVLEGLEPEALAPVVAALAALGEPAAAPLAEAAERAASRERRKLLRGALHRLRSSGVRVESAPRHAGHSVLRPLESEPERGFVGPIDPGGARQLVLATPVRGGARVIEAVISDRLGVLHASAFEAPRRDVRRLLAELGSPARGSLVEVEPEGVRALARRADALGGAAPRPEVDAAAVAELVRGATGATPGERARARLAGQELSAAEADSRLRELAGAGALAPWPLDPERAAEAVRRLDAAGSSKLVLPPLQQRDREAAALGEEAARVFDAGTRERLALRLEETSAWLLGRGDEAGARAALATAARIRTSPDPLSVELLRTLLELSLDLARRSAREEQRGRLIVEP